MAGAGVGVGDEQTFVYPFRNCHPRDARHARNAALRISLDQQLIHLCQFLGFLDRGGVK
jgi:hypothetical protein